MEFIGITRVIDGKDVDLFVAACPDHNYYYKGQPPLTSGCPSCWQAYYLSEWAIAGAKKEDVDKLESVIRHAAEADSKGEFDFKPKFEIDIKHEN